MLWPVSLLFRSLVALRRGAFKAGILSSWRSPVPVVVVGNIAVGGAGKTPLVIALCDQLTSAGYNIGIASRGFGGAVKDPANDPMIVTSESDTRLAGDEAVLIARRTGLPVVVSPGRVSAVQHLVAGHAIDCVVCDDGLQHYALDRDLEIAVVDAVYRFGNGFCLPAGPLREPVSRLKAVDFTVFSGSEAGYTLAGDELVSIADENIRQGLESLSGCTVHAVAGIASPENFYRQLQKYNIKTIDHSLGDHAAYTATDLQFDDQLPIVMTEKDMVKCGGFGLQNAWYLPVSARLNDDLEYQIISAIKSLIAKRLINAE